MDHKLKSLIKKCAREEVAKIFSLLKPERMIAVLFLLTIDSPYGPHILVSILLEN